MKMTGAIFDMDGTLLDSMPIWDRVGIDYLAGLGIQARPGFAGAAPDDVDEAGGGIFSLWLRRELAGSGDYGWGQRAD